MFRCRLRQGVSAPPNVVTNVESRVDCRDKRKQGEPIDLYERFVQLVFCSQMLGTTVHEIVEKPKNSKATAALGVAPLSPKEIAIDCKASVQFLHTEVSVRRNFQQVFAIEFLPG